MAQWVRDSQGSSFYNLDQADRLSVGRGSDGMTEGFYVWAQYGYGTAGYSVTVGGPWMSEAEASKDLARIKG
jgi:hypothetical protein